MPPVAQVLLAGVALVVLALTLPTAEQEAEVTNLEPGTSGSTADRVPAGQADGEGARAGVSGSGEWPAAALRARPVVDDDASAADSATPGRPATDDASDGRPIRGLARGTDLVALAAAQGTLPPLGAGEATPAAHSDRREHHQGPASPEGFLVAGGESQAGTGSDVTYTVELETAVDVDISELVEVVEESLYDPRSWANDHALRRVDDPHDADIRVVLATPATVDALCAHAGLNTAGIFSCWNGRFAALNSLRWTEGAWGFGDDLASYRRYLVNHEFGHGLGYGHVDCPGAGHTAPIMMQQTKGTDGCEPNGWPYPDLAPDTAAG